MDLERPDFRGGKVSKIGIDKHTLCALLEGGTRRQLPAILTYSAKSPIAAKIRIRAARSSSVISGRQISNSRTVRD